MTALRRGYGHDRKQGWEHFEFGRFVECLCANSCSCEIYFYITANYSDYPLISPIHPLSFLSNTTPPMRVLTVPSFVVTLIASKAYADSILHSERVSSESYQLA